MMFDTPAYRLGFGTYSLCGCEGADIIETALEAGYRHVDTALMYENEAIVGDAIDRADVNRDEVFVATKIGHFTEPEKTPEYIREGVHDSLARLGIETIDLLYHHWPRRYGEIETVLPVFEDLYETGIVRNLGVSNYTVSWLDH
jgi:2,5-diketo-D-gluconate reductase B